jgi:hypothetical protein
MAYSGKRDSDSSKETKPQDKENSAQVQERVVNDWKKMICQYRTQKERNPTHIYKPYNIPPRGERQLYETRGASA